MRTKSLLVLMPIFLLVSGCGNKPSSSSSSSLPSSKKDTSFITSSPLDPSGGFDIHDSKYITYLGRHSTETDGEYISLSNCGFVIDVMCESAANSINTKLISNSNTGGNKQFINIYVDGVLNNTIEVENGTKTVEIVKNLPTGNHRIEFVKRNEGNFASLKLKEISFSDNIKVLEHKEERPIIEFYGDSITCGYGNLGSNTDQEFLLSTEDSTNGYTYLTAKNLDFRCSNISFSGIGLAYSLGAGNMMTKYKTDCKNSWDLKKDKAKITIINLGTNDNTQINAMTPSEKINAYNTFKNNLSTMLTDIYQANRNARVILCYNMMVSVATEIVNIFKDAAKAHMDNEESCYTLEFTPDTKGTHGHPGKDGHKVHAEKLTKFIRDNQLDK